MPGPNRPPRSRHRLGHDVAAALDVPESARERQVAEAMLGLIDTGYADDDDDRLPAVATTWLRHLVDLIDEHDWRAAELPAMCQQIADDAVSDIFIDDVAMALEVVAPADRATGPAATVALSRRLPPFCERLIIAMRRATGDGAHYPAL